MIKIRSVTDNNKYTKGDLQNEREWHTLSDIFTAFKIRYR